MDIDFSAVDRVRLAKREQWKADNGYSLSYLPFVAKAICIAIRDFPNVNSSIDGDGILVHDELHLALGAASLCGPYMAAKWARDRSPLVPSPTHPRV